MAADTPQPITTVSANNKKGGKGKTIIIIAATVVLAGIAIFTAVRLFQLREQAVAPTAPESEPEAIVPCAEACPDPEGILRNCTPPDLDGTSQDSLCYADVIGRVESCGGRQYCCSLTGWTANMAACATTAPTSSPTGTATAAPTSSPTGTATAAPTSSPTGTATAAPIATVAPTSAPDTLPDAGISSPTVIGAGFGVTLLILSLILAL